jgi:uncharacterized protein
MSSEPERVVFDTSTLIGAVLRPRSLPAQALTHARRMGVLVASVQTLEELRGVLGRPVFDRYREPADRLRFFSIYVSWVTVVDEVPPVVACRDPKDDKFLALAKAAQARWLVSSDSDLLVTGSFEETRILLPTAFVGLTPPQ